MLNNFETVVAFETKKHPKTSLLLAEVQKFLLARQLVGGRNLAVSPKFQAGWGMEHMWYHG